MKSNIRIFALAIAVLMFLGMAGYVLISDNGGKKGAPGNFHLDEARIKSVKEMVSLCTLEINEEAAIKDSINGKWIVAREKIRGRVKYDLEKIIFENRGDTLVVRLPSPEIEIRESESPDSYEILDFWDGDHTFFTRNLTAAEENILKRRWQSRTANRIMEEGYLDKARDNARSVLIPLFQNLRGQYGTDGPVILVEDQSR